MFDFIVEGDGLIYARLEGFFDLETARKFSAEVRRIAAESRRVRGYARILLDSSAGTVQSADAVDEFTRAGSLVQTPRDKIAVVVATALMKMQTLRLIEGVQEQVFVSLEEAREWLAEA